MNICVRVIKHTNYASFQAPLCKDTSQIHSCRKISATEIQFKICKNNYHFVENQILFLCEKIASVFQLQIFLATNQSTDVSCYC